MADRPGEEVRYRLRIDPEGWDAPQPTFFLGRDRGSQVFLGATDAAEVEWLGPAPPGAPRRFARGRAVLGLLGLVLLALLALLVWRLR